MDDTLIIDRARELLDKIKGVIKKQNPIKDINLFSILGMETKEVSAHSAFLYYIFKPFEKDDSNLRVLYDFLRNKKEDLPESPDFLDIYREIAFNNGRIDFLIVFGTTTQVDAIVIELKIRADEQINQIDRYKKYLEDNGYNSENIFFLTPKGNRSSKTGDSIPISLLELCENVFSQIENRLNKEEQESYKQYITILNQYKDIVKKISEDDIMDYTDLIKQKKDFIAIDELQRTKTDKLTTILERFFEDLQEEINTRIEQGNLFISIYDVQKEAEWIKPSNYYKNNKKSYPALIFSINDNGELVKEYLSLLNEEQKQLFKEKQLELLFYVEIDSNLYCGITLRSEGVDYINLPFKEEKKNKEKNITLFRGAWLSWQHIMLNSKKINFKDYNGSEGLFELLDDSLNLKDDSIKHVVDNILESFSEQYNLLINYNTDQNKS